MSSTAEVLHKVNGEVKEALTARNTEREREEARPSEETKGQNHNNSHTTIEAASDQLAVSERNPRWLLLGGRRSSSSRRSVARRGREADTNQKRAKAQQLIIKATSTKALLFQSKQVFYLLEQAESGKKLTQSEGRERRAKTEGKGVTKPSKLGYPITQRKASRVESESNPM